MKIIIFVLFINTLLSSSALAKMSIVTTTTNIESLVSEISGNFANVTSLCKGSRDPHYLEAKPSYMVKASKADLVVSVGLDLEIGWLPSILRGARNPDILIGNSGHLEIGTKVARLSTPTSKVSRADGDVHPQGNPHVLLDPIRAGDIAVAIAKRLGELDKPNEKTYKNRGRAIKERFAKKVNSWQKRIKKSGITNVISHHKTLSYFFNRFGMSVPIVIEPKPGVPPSSKHVLKIIKTAKEKKIQLILIENFFKDSVAQRIKKDVQGLKVKTIPVAVKGESGINNLDDLYEHLVSTIEGK